MRRVDHLAAAREDRSLAADALRTSLRAATPHDLEVVRDLLRAARLPIEGLEDQFGDQYAVAELGEERVIGAAGIEIYDRVGLLRSVVVVPEHRRSGLGGRLTRDRIAWAGHHGLEAIYLLTAKAAPFFARHGFVAVPRASAPLSLLASLEFAVICPSTAVCMRLALRE